MGSLGTDSALSVPDLDFALLDVSFFGQVCIFLLDLAGCFWDKCQLFSVLVFVFSARSDTFLQTWPGEGHTITVSHDHLTFLCTLVWR